MDAPIDQLFAKSSQIGGQRAVVNDVADLGHDAADEIWVDFGSEDGFASQNGFHALRDGLLLLGRHRRGGDDFYLDAPASAVIKLAQLLADRTQNKGPLMLGKHLEKVQQQRMNAPG